MATKIGPTPQGVSLGLLETSSTQSQVLGEKCYSNDGRTFRYVKAGAVALVAGNSIQSPAVVTAHTNLTPSPLPALGDTTITSSSITVTANDYANGTATIEIGTTGAGLTYLIKSNPTTSAAACVFQLEDPVLVTTTGTVTVSFIKNPYNGVIQSPATTLTGTVVGVAIIAIPISNFGWIQTRGVAGLLVSGAPIVGSAVGVPTGTAGMAVADSAILTHIGVVSKAAITTQNTPVFLTLD